MSTLRKKKSVIKSNSTVAVNAVRSPDAIVEESPMSFDIKDEDRTVGCFYDDGHANVPQKASRRQAMRDFVKSMKEKSRTMSESGVPDNEATPQRSATRGRRVDQPYDKNGFASVPVKDDVLDRIMGAPKAEPKPASDSFYLKQRIRANSRAASATNRSPASGLSQAERDRQPLSAEELEATFVGAPYFRVEQRGARYVPQVLFRGGDAIVAAAIYGTDHKGMAHETFEASTLGVHQVREADERPGLKRHETGSRLTLLLDVAEPMLEVPNMLSAIGLDRGTIGFEHFLQLSVADSVEQPDEPHSLEHRHLLISGPEALGLRNMNVEELIGRLAELDELYRLLKSGDASSSALNEGKISEMGEDLFDKLLSAELGISPAGTGSVSLGTQITALQETLNVKGLWHDFSMVEWRIQVGALLWASEDDDDPQQPSERDVLILQIALAAELAVRLEILAALKVSNGVPPMITDADREKIAAQRSRKIDWDVLLAERFLEHLTAMSGSALPAAAGNRSSFFSAITCFSAASNGATPPIFEPKNIEQQITGLMSFAESIGWPNTEAVKLQLTTQTDSGRPKSTMSAMSIYATPMSSPQLPASPSAPSNRLSYFGSSALQRRPGISRMTTAQSMQLFPTSAPSSHTGGFQTGGWLSKSWLSGLVLPGEAASHFLISTLLENSPQAIEALGDCANLYGGFIYQGRGYWSKSCIVGRVLAATEGSKECMGWISVPALGQADGWVNLDIQDVVLASKIKTPERIAQDSDPLHNTSATSVQVGDFTTPLDGPPVMGNEVRFSSLALPSPTASTPGQTTLTFTSPLNPKLPPLTLNLTHDIHFISSYPCHPTPLPRSRRPTSAKPPLTLSPPVSPIDSLTDKALPASPAHPLHVEYRYHLIPAASLLTLPAQGLLRDTVEGEEVEVLVLDARGSWELEVLGRAWCAQVGESAVVGKEGRTCMACCIREARGLRVRVVVRV
ncbi:hypothetical protein B0A48_07568 [Cryoendolithus antarcticus]|uniref:Uncharacterized protein n=1 Tax=Cryoendolithus antarcticus TaxID=1507870 RepID=A0A1V8T736_9PEZI|nr:hypothetical protein B0A48_07568 [Cryoendolithus antarcticus]